MISLFIRPLGLNFKISPLFVIWLLFFGTSLQGEVPSGPYNMILLDCSEKAYTEKQLTAWIDAAVLFQIDKIILNMGNPSGCRINIPTPFETHFVPAVNELPGIGLYGITYSDAMLKRLDQYALKHKIYLIPGFEFENSHRNEDFSLMEKRFAELFSSTLVYYDWDRLDRDSCTRLTQWIESNQNEISTHKRRMIRRERKGSIPKEAAFCCGEPLYLTHQALSGKKVIAFRKISFPDLTRGGQGLCDALKSPLSSDLQGSFLRKKKAGQFRVGTIFVLPSSNIKLTHQNDQDELALLAGISHLLNKGDRVDHLSAIELRTFLKDKSKDLDNFQSPVASLQKELWALPRHYSPSAMRPSNLHLYDHITVEGKADRIVLFPVTRYFGGKDALEVADGLELQALKLADHFPSSEIIIISAMASSTYPTKYFFRELNHYLLQLDLYPRIRFFSIECEFPKYGSKEGERFYEKNSLSRQGRDVLDKLILSFD